ncbi:hypothetical protein QYM36_006996 [Artemia franciscana]|uniref:Uncharacterized protein n=1 Tax=Artemia franciscana TaxID=6661 RepID=A0AA88L2N8_ARTSF|nr:hypothetical protein QYM36_006996 [Artemia franciscana]
MLKNSFKSYFSHIRGLYRIRHLQVPKGTKKGTFYTISQEDCKKRSSEEEADENGNPFQNGSNQILVSPAPAYAIGYSYTNALKKLTYQKPVTVVLNLARLYTDSGMSEQVLYGGREKS